MIIPGGTIIVICAIHMQYDLDIDKYRINPVVGWTMLLVLSYVIGLVNHGITTKLWEKFRNNPNMIYYAYQKNNCHETANINILFPVFYMILKIGIVIIIAGFIVCRCKMVENKAMLFVAFYVLILTLSFCNCIGQPQNESCNKCVKTYYCCYYYVAKNRYRDDIFIMEAQVAFLQNMILPLIGLAFLPSEEIKSYFSSYEEMAICNLKVLITILIVSLIPTIICRQLKIYNCVFEDYKHLRYLNINKKQKTDENK